MGIFKGAVRANAADEASTATALRDKANEHEQAGNHHQAAVYHNAAEQAARREAAEETGLDLTGVMLDRIGVYDAPGRDVRGRYVSVAYGAVLDDAITPVAGDDAASAAWVPLRTAARVAHRGGFAFDHADILTDAARRYGFGPDTPGSWDLWS